MRTSFAAIFLLLGFAAAAPAQISLTTAVDLALRNNPRVLAAQADLRKAQAQIDETHDAYIPSINAGAGLGQAYGYLPNPPTLFTVTATSLVFGASQPSYMHSARAGFNSAVLALQEARQAVAQDAVLAYLAVDHDQLRLAAVRQQAGDANTLVTIVQQRVDAGQDSAIELKQSQITAAELRVAVLNAEDTTAADRDHLARLIGVPPGSVAIDSSAFDRPIPDAKPTGADSHGYATPAVAAAFEAARARRLQAKGDSTFLYIPQISSVIQYNRYATFTGSFKTIEALQNASGHIGADEAAFGVQINLPVLDRVRRAKARESADEAAHSLYDAENAQIEALDGQAKLSHSLEETQAQLDLDTLRQQLAQLQLDVLQQQMQSGNGDPNSPQVSPKDEQKARIDERTRFLAVIDSTYQLRQTRIQLLRQSGKLMDWLRNLAVPTPATPQP